MKAAEKKGGRGKARARLGLYFFSHAGLRTGREKGGKKRGGRKVHGDKEGQEERENHQLYNKHIIAREKEERKGGTYQGPWLTGWEREEGSERLAFSLLFLSPSHRF